MHRSASTSRASDEFFINLSPATKGSPGVKVADVDNLSTYNPIPDISKKDTTHIKLPGENFIHLIPLVLVLCAITLWAFSHPVVLDLSKSSDPAAVKVKESQIQHSANGTGLSSSFTPKDYEQEQGLGKGKSERFLAQKSG